MTETGVGWGGNMSGIADGVVGGFWWLDQLGLLATRGVTVQHRHSLVGSWPPCLIDLTYTPRPDYFTSVLWRRLVGTGVLNASLGVSSDDHGHPGGEIKHEYPGGELKRDHPRGDIEHLRVYAHCGRTLKAPYTDAATLSLVIINLSAKESFSFPVSGLLRGRGVGGDLRRRHEYWLGAPPGADLSSGVVALNGVALGLSRDGTLPPMTPLVATGDAITVAPLRYGFVTFPMATVQAC